jgi:hypothetical protein
VSSSADEIFLVCGVKGLNSAPLQMWCSEPYQWDWCQQHLVANPAMAWNAVAAMPRKLYDIRDS